ncbi:MAG: PspC domain-containing protein [candidate division Zixibacteria bacterium]|jgi:phage shock protein PspC (stress-responsive transcriptional regulator)|nr:PspC domain-containing protein [candidate division Zixibacteria bacterium]
MPSKRLYRSREHAMIGGVCAGIAEYFDTDPSLIRLALVLLFFAGGVGILAYIVAWIIVPQKPLITTADAAEATLSESTPASSTDSVEDVNRPRFILGIILIVLGGLFLLGSLNVWHWFSFFRLWPVILIIIGIMIITKGVEKGGGHEN